MNSSTPSSIAVLCAALLAVSLSGCVATKYQFAPPDRPSAVTLDLRPTQSPIAIHLDAVVSPGTPSSWKRDALWSEYEFFIANRTNRRWRIESVGLVTTSSRAVQAGTDPWELESHSATWWRQHGVDAAYDIVWGIGDAAAIPARIVATAGVAVVANGGYIRPDIAISAMGIAIASAGVPNALKAPADTNRASKEVVAGEFQRRRKALLAWLPPGGETRGSAFFPITPDPQQLILVCRSDAETRTVTIELAGTRSWSANTTTPADRRDLRIVPATLSP